MLHVLYIDKHRCTQADVDIADTGGERECTRMHTQTHAGERIYKRTLLDERKENCIQCVGRRNLKMCPDVGRLFKDFWDVLYICIYRTV